MNQCRGTAAGIQPSAGLGLKPMSVSRGIFGLMPKSDTSARKKSLPTASLTEILLRGSTPKASEAGCHSKVSPSVDQPSQSSSAR